MWQRRARARRRRSPGSPVYFSVVEPGTTAIRLLVVEVGEAQATVWGWAESPGLGSGVDVRRLTTACDSALAQAEEMAQDLSERWILPDQILVGLPGSQLRGHAWPITQRRSRPDHPVEERELQALLGRALRLTVNRLQSGEPEETQWLLMDAAPGALTVDGRGVTDPVGFHGREIGATVFAALAPAEIIETWGLVARNLEFSSLTLTAAPLALAAGLSEAQEILVDVGGGTTDLIWCRAGRPMALESLPIGGEELTRVLIQKWNLSPSRAERLKRAYARGKLDELAQAHVWEVMLPALQTWLDETEAALARLNRDEPLPQRIRLFGGGSVLPEIAQAIGSLAWSQRLHFVRYPQVSCSRPTDVRGVVNRTDLGRKPGDVSALALAAAAAHQHASPDRPGRILSELCQE